MNPIEDTRNRINRDIATVREDGEEDMMVQHFRAQYAELGTRVIGNIIKIGVTMEQTEDLEELADAYMTLYKMNQVVITYARDNDHPIDDDGDSCDCE